MVMTMEKVLELWLVEKVLQLKERYDGRRGGRSRDHRRRRRLTTTATTKN